MNTKSIARVRGFTLIELMVVLAISTLAAIYLAYRAKESAEDKMATAAADNIVALGKGLSAYIANNTGTLGAAPSTPITMATLTSANSCGIGAQCLPSSFGSPAWAGGYAIRVVRQGSVAPYYFDALACTTNAFVVSGKIRFDLVGNAVKKVGGAGGMTYDATGAYGNAGGWSALAASYPNSTVPGKLCYYVYQSLNNLDSQYLRIDGGNKMKATLQMNANPISGATTVDATGLVTAGAVNSLGAVQATGNITTSGGDVKGVNVTGSGAVTGGSLVSNGGLTVAGNATVNGTSTLTGDVSMGSKAAIAGAATVGDTLTVANDINLTALTTRTNPTTTSSLKALTPKNIEVSSITIQTLNGGAPIVTGASSQGVVNGFQVSKPNCTQGGGQQGAYAIPHYQYGHVGSGNWGVSTRLVDNGSSWTLEVLDQTVSPAVSVPSANVTNYGVVIRTFCQY